MEVRLATWKIKTLVSKKDLINPKPQYQRTSVWNRAKKKLLIDSILRGYDLPKFYLRATPNDPTYEYEVTDGQQRMRSIWEFVSHDRHESYSLDENIIDGFNTRNIDYQNLGQLRDKFDSYELNIAIIEDSSPEEIRSLFARLQMGSSLNQVELRHAVASNIGAAILSVVETHHFFLNSRITNSRYKHQDYLDHVITLSIRDGDTDLRAQDIRELYEELKSSNWNTFQPYIKKAIAILNRMKQVNDLSPGIFKNKWAFVDTYWIMHQNFDRINTINANSFVNRFHDFENKRLQYQRNPEVLIEDRQSDIYDRDLYDYIMAFKYSGNLKDNISIRNRVFSRVLLP